MSLRQGGALAAVIVVCALGSARDSWAQGTLPSGWTSRDVGAPAIAGSSSYSGGTWTLNGAGSDIWETTDQFHYAYRQATGDIDISVRVASIEQVHSWTKAGLMIRESLTGNARHVDMLLTALEGFAFQHRTTAGAATTHTSGGPGAPPRWVRLVRSGNQFTGYRSNDGASWTVVGTVTVALPANVYVGLAVSSHHVGDAARATFTNLTQPTGLPSPWLNRDIGGPTPAGSAAVASGTFTIAAGGTDIWDLSDQFQFVYQPIQGDTEIVARVTGLERTHDWAKAGVMIRETLNPDSRHLSMFATGASGWSYQDRTITGGTTFHTPGPSGAPNGWVRLVRQGNTFTAYHSTDGNTWSTVGTDTVSLASTVYVGLAVTSHDPGALTSATFTNVTVRTPTSANRAPTLQFTSPVDGATFTAPATLEFRVSASDSDGTIARVELYRGSTMVKNDVTNPYSHNLTNVQAGTYQLRAVAYDDDGASAQTTVSVTVNPAGNQAPTVSITTPSSGAGFAAPATIGIQASASDTDGTVARVEFYSGSTLIRTDTTSPYTASWASVPAGSYTLTARAYDNAGASRTSSGINVTVTAGSNQPPLVAITNPAGGTSYGAPASMTIAATASDSDGTIANVDFYSGGQLIGSDSSAPYTAAWNNVPAGSYSLTAVARDNAGATRTSTAVAVTVSTTPPRPTTVVFNASTDHATNVNSYTVAIYRTVDPVTGTPVATRDLGKPTPSSGQITVDISTLIDPLATGSYYAVVRAIGPGGTTPSAPSATFTK